MKWMLLFLLLPVSVVKASGPVGMAPEERLIVTLRADAARCAIDGQLAVLNVPDNADAARIQQAGDVGRRCEVEMRERDKPKYREALEQAPQSRPQLEAMYAKWLNYLNALANPYAKDEHRSAEAEFESAVSALRAAVDGHVQ